MKYLLNILFLICLCLGTVADTLQIPHSSQWQPLLNPRSHEFGFVAIGDMGTGWSTHKKLMSSIAELPVNQYPAVFLLGDIVYPSAKPELFEKKIVQPNQPLYEKGFRLYPVLGNHDWLYEKAKYVKEYFQINDFYTFTIGRNAQFWALNSNDMTTGQLDWFKKSLSRSTKSWKIILLHHSPYSSGTVHRDNKQLIENLVPILEEHNVDLVLSGHNHLYERMSKINNILYITSGGGSASIHRSAPHDHLEKVARVHHYLTVSGNKKNMLIKAIDIEGNLIDSIELKH